MQLLWCLLWGEGKRKEQDVFPPLPMLMFFYWILIALMLRANSGKNTENRAHIITLPLIMKLVIAASLRECVGLRRLRRRKIPMMILYTVGFISFSCLWVDSDEMTPIEIQ